jgi:uncharacterized protein YhaN
MDKQRLQDIATRWEGVERGFSRLTFDEAQADMKELLAAVREQDQLRRRIAELEIHVKKRNEDMKAFATEVSRLANQKYADYSA